MDWNKIVLTFFAGATIVLFVTHAQQASTLINAGGNVLLGAGNLLAGNSHG